MPPRPYTSGSLDRPGSKRRRPLYELSRESVDVGRNRNEIRTIPGKITVVAQGESDGGAAILGGRECRFDGLREGLVLDSNLGKSLPHGAWDNLKVGEGSPALVEGVSGLFEFAFRGRNDERLTRFKAAASGVLEILLAEHATGSIAHGWKRNFRIGEFVRELTSRLPKRRPELRARARQHACRECGLPESPCFVQLAATRLAESKHGIDGRRRERGLDCAHVLGEPLNTPGANAKLPSKLLRIVRLEVKNRSLEKFKP